MNDLWKWSKISNYFEETPAGIRCTICPNECLIKEGKTGDCRSRTIHNGKLYSIAYGNPCALHVDPIEKKPLYHYFPESKAFSIATTGCNLRCKNCQNSDISQVSPTATKNYDLFPEKVVEMCIKQNCESIAYTYTEPITFYEYMMDTAKIAKTKNIKNVMISSGYINSEPLEELSEYIDAANIDLKSFSDEIYQKLNGASLQPVLDTLLTLHKKKIWLEITNLLIPGWTDDMNMIEKMCKWLVENGLEGYPLHFSRFYPSYKLMDVEPTPVSTMEKAHKIAKGTGIKYVYLGNVRNNDLNHTYCSHCSKKLIHRNGYIISEKKIKNGKCMYCGEIIHGVFN